MDKCYIIKIITADIETSDPKPRCQKSGIISLSKALSWLLRHEEMVLFSLMKFLHIKR